MLSLEIHTRKVIDTDSEESNDATTSLTELDEDYTFDSGDEEIHVTLK